MALKPSKYNRLPLWILLAGLLGLGLRYWLLKTGIDEKGLFIADHPADTLSYILTAVVLACLGIWCLGVVRTPSYDRLFHPSAMPWVGAIIGCAGILATDVYELLQLKDIVSLLCFLAGIGACGCLLYTGFCRLKGRHPKILFRSIVTVYCMIHLVSQYRLWSALSQVQLYFFPVLASVFLMLATYQHTSMDAGFANAGQYIFTTMASAFFCFMAVPATGGLFYLAMALWLLLDICDVTRVPRRRKHTPMALPQAVRPCLRMLQKAGYQAYLVGGCVRDSLLGRKPQDYDLCTDATPEEIAKVFSRYELVRNGEKHGTIGVIMGGTLYEITTFRTEGGYQDNRHPDWVRFVRDVEDDLARRDFTINAMAYNPKEGYVDPWGGQKDLEDGVIRAVGDPDTRFTEDPLRILRGLRFAVRFGFWVQEPTKQAMFRHVHLLDGLAKERVFEELCKLLPHMTAEDIVEYQPILSRVIPELAPCVDFQQHSPHHAFDVYTHIAHVTAGTPPVLSVRLAALLHDIGKPLCFTQDETGRGHFYNHAKIGAELAEQVLLRLKAPTALREQVVWLIQNHMIPFEPDVKQLRRRLGRIGGERCGQLLALQRADFCNKGTGGDGAYFDEIQVLLEQIAQEDTCLTVRDLAINGSDLLCLGYTPGPKVGKVLSTLLGCVQDEILTNNYSALMNAAKKMLQEDTK